MAEPIQNLLQRLGLTADESVIFLSLIGKPKTQLQLSRATGIARSSVYRLVDGLIEKGLIQEITTGEGKLLETTKPEALELQVVKQELAAEQQRADFNRALALLNTLSGKEDQFAVRTYTGRSGFRQMLWNELRAKEEICLFACGTLDAPVGRRFAEKYRAEVISRQIKQRAIENDVTAAGPMQTDLVHYDKYFELRLLPRDTLDIQPEISIHGDTVSIYNTFTDDVLIGTEIRNPFLSHLMRQMFEHYWQLASPK